MKTFDDLVFNPHPNYLFGGVLAQVFFDNGYGASVITGGASYAGEGTYEVAVLKGTKDDQVICNDHVSCEGTFQSPEEVTALMKKMQELPNA